MKKIITSVGMLVFVAAVVAGGTGAFFSDTETSTANVFTAGALDLKVDSVGHINGLVCFDGAWHPDGIVEWVPETEQAEGFLRLVPGTDEDDVAGAVAEYNEDFPANVPAAGTPCSSTWEMTDLGPTNVFFDFGDLKPGDNGENTISLHVDNNDAYMCAVIGNVQSDDNGLTEPEIDAGDVTGGAGQGELAAELEFLIWEDDGDNILETVELGSILYQGGADDGLAGVYPLYTPQTEVFPGGETKYLGAYWCYGDLVLSGTTLTCNGAPVTNMSQTDSLTADISFYIEQARNNSNFRCPTEISTDTEVTREVRTADLETQDRLAAYLSGDWFFYNDTNNTIMSINQFAGNGGVNNISAVTGSNGAAVMTLDTGVNPRYNIATYRYKDVKLADISVLEYRVQDVLDASQSPYLHFNVDFNNSDTWQRRLVQVPTGVVPGVWTEVDALAGTWTYSGPTWPAGLVDTSGTTPGTTGRTWADILANYPNAETRSTDSFFGIRVGHPGPSGETGYVDSINFNGETTDFVN